MVQEVFELKLVHFADFRHFDGDLEALRVLVFFDLILWRQHITFLDVFVQVRTVAPDWA